MNHDLLAVFSVLKEMDKPVSIIVNETFCEGGNRMTLKIVRCPDDVEGARAINEDLLNQAPIVFGLDDLSVVVAVIGWGFQKPRTRNSGFEFIYYVQPVTQDDMGLAPGMGMFGIDPAWQAARKEVWRQRRFDRYMLYKQLAAH